MNNEELDASRLYETYRPLLFSVSYRLLASVTEAEDIVQETFLAWSERAGRGTDTGVTNVKAYLCRIAANLCADRIRSSARQRALYSGPWLPEPLIGDAGMPEDACVRKESVTTAYLLLLQQLSETERIVFVLREAFAFSYDEIAEVTGKTAANCRQIFARARRGMPRPAREDAPAMPDRAEAQQLLVRFAQSVERGDIAGVIRLLTGDAVLLSDGGGKVKAALNPIRTPERIAAFLAGVAGKMPPGTETALQTVNGLPGALFSADGVVWAVLSLDMKGGRISGVYIMMNPERLTHLL